MNKLLGVEAHSGRDKERENDLYDEYGILQLLLLCAFWALLRSHRRILDRIKTATYEYLQSAVEGVAASADHEVGKRDRCYAEDVVRYAEWREGQTKQGNDGLAFTPQQTIYGFEISENPWRLFDLLSDH